MELTKYAHSCVRLTKGGRALVIDPGVFSEAELALTGADAVLITHEHADHLDPQALQVALANNGELRVWGPASIGETFVDFPERFTAIAPAQTLTIAGFEIETFGGQHAIIHPSIPVVANIGYLIDGGIYHPGDSFIVPNKPVQTLLVPIQAPWSKVAEVIDFVVSVRASHAFQIHDSQLTQAGLGVIEGHVTRIGAQYGSAYRHLASGESILV